MTLTRRSVRSGRIPLHNHIASETVQVLRWRSMRLLAAVVLAGCSFQPRAAPVSGDAPLHVDAPPGPGLDGPRSIDAPPDAPPDAFVYLDAPAHPPNWWNPAWGSRMQLTISNNATGAMASGYQVGLAFDLDAAPCSGNRDQVRIVYNNQTEVPRVIDEVGTTQWTWFPLQAQIDAGATSTSYWLYCNNPAPNAALKDPATVFDFWDDFNGTSLGTAWTATAGGVSVANGSVTIGSSGGIHSTATYGPGRAIDVMATPTSASVSNPDWWFGFESNFTFQAPWIVWFANNANQIHPSVNDTSQHDDPPVTLDTAPHLWGVETYGTSAAFRLADAVVDSRTTNITSPLNLRLHVLQSGSTVSFDWVRVRKVVTPAPTVSVGTVETY